MSHALAVPLQRSAAGVCARTLCAGLCLLHLRLAKKKGWLRRGPFASARGGGAPSRCRLCGGSGRRVCAVCAGRGALGRGGFNRRNPVRMDSLVGSKWTAAAAIDGKWRHFLCVGRRGTSARSAVARLSSTCGPAADRVVIDVPLAQLRSRAQWTGGWTTLADIAAQAAAAGDEAHAPGATCSACSGRRAVPCPRCDGLGQVGL